MHLMQPVFSQYLIAIAFIGAGVLHFVKPDFYLNIMPDYIPYHRLMICLSGAAEILGGLGLLIPKVHELAAWGIIAMLIVFLTVHVDMIIQAWKHEAGLWYLMAVILRLPLQFVLIYWIHWAFIQS